MTEPPTREASDKLQTASDFDANADSYSQRFADPGAIAQGQVRLMARWGRPVSPGSTILEVGCADGYVTAELARGGFRVIGVDISPRMVAVARQRLAVEGLEGEFLVADVDALQPPREVDVTVALMRNFFTYAADPGATIKRLGALTRNKIVVDLNPRDTSIAEAMEAVRAAGFGNVAWRPIFIPQRIALPRLFRGALRGAERVPLLRSIPLRWKFLVAVKGERV